jgi:nucleotide-binding universal stress UspA family protein
MKVLIAYDGSPCSDSALDDLTKAGLPSTGEARIISVAEVWLPPSIGIDSSLPDEKIELLLAHHREKGEAMVRSAAELAAMALARTKAILPEWKIDTVSTYGSPAWEILSAADDFDADLIVVGSQGRSAVSKFILGSISQKVLTEAPCSVRIARGKNEVDPAPVRIVIGFDSTKGAEAAVSTVAARSWPSGTEVKLVSAVEDLSPSLVGSFIPMVATATAEVNIAEHSILSELGAKAILKLKDSGLNAEMELVNGDAKNAIAEFAESWDADAIFVGANAFGNRLERFLIGSTSSAVASRAHCSVEVIRIKGNQL